VATPGSFNTEIGLPLTVLRAEETTHYLVLEMGARHAGDIRYLTTLTPPQVGIVLNVGSASSTPTTTSSPAWPATPPRPSSPTAPARRTSAPSAPDGITIINDAFNANPESTAAGLRSLTCYAGTRRTIAVLGEMRELGPAAETAHRDTGRLVADLGIGVLVTVGHGLMDPLADAARTSPSPPIIHAAEDPDELLPMLRRLLQRGDVVFIKASSSVGLENFAATLQQGDPARPAG
jgi:UDP-N-acetylmuramyl pentapeptide synthase